MFMGSRTRRITLVTLLAAIGLSGTVGCGSTSGSTASGDGSSSGAHDAESALAPPASPPPIATQWIAAWNGADAAELGSLFTEDATYTDLAVGKTSTGSTGVTAWKQGTNALIDQAHFDLVRAFQAGDAVAIEGTYRGQIKGAPAPFELPIATILTLRGDKIAKDSDYYNLSDLLEQSGLPPTWTPPQQ